MAPAHALITKASRVTVGMLITVCLLVASGIGFAYKTKEDLKAELSDFRTTNAVQDQKIDQTREDLREIKNDIKELLNRTAHVPSPSKP